MIRGEPWGDREEESPRIFIEDVRASLLVAIGWGCDEVKERCFALKVYAQGIFDMNQPWLSTLKILTALGSGLIAGVFFAFSVFVMRGLARIAPPQGIAAMQSINITVLNPLFLGVFMGTALACLVLLVLSLLNWRAPGSPMLFAGCVLYLVGTFGVTVAFNVPRNDALAVVKPESVEAAKLWANYLVTWTAWNHVRTVAAMAATVAFMLSLSSRSS